MILIIPNEEKITCDYEIKKFVRIFHKFNNHIIVQLVRYGTVLKYFETSPGDIFLRRANRYHQYGTVLVPYSTKEVSLLCLVTVRTVRQKLNFR